MSAIADEVYVLQGANTLFPGEEPGFFKKSPLMQEYFSHVMAAERDVFGNPRFTPVNACVFSMRSPDINKVDVDWIADALAADLIIVFGATYIRPPLVDLLIERRAVNIHMGLSPWYRGSSCNFWALYDNEPGLVGATIHLLSRGLDSGPILFHALPSSEAKDGFALGMQAVKAAHLGLVDKVKKNELFEIGSEEQRKHDERRYTRNADFTDEIAAEYLARTPSSEDVEAALAVRNANLQKFRFPFVL